MEGMIKSHEGQAIALSCALIRGNFGFLRSVMARRFISIETVSRRKILETDCGTRVMFVDESAKRTQPAR